MNRLYRFGTLFFAGLVAFGFFGPDDFSLPESFFGLRFFSLTVKREQRRER